MVGHQAIAPYLRTRLARRLRQKIAVQRIIAVLEKGWRPPIAALGYRISNAGNDKAREAGHFMAMAELVYLVNWHCNLVIKLAIEFLVYIFNIYIKSTQLIFITKYRIISYIIFQLHEI